ncbi:MAG: dihydrodipicolinate reductase [Spirochaetes bacterium]|nr:dihydrodipicolinate reductase [Spirochaetota bacterium]
MNVFVVGSGKLAEEILSALHGSHIGSVRRWSDIASCLRDDIVVVHAGSGRELDAVHAYCSENRKPMIELATGMNYDSFDPDFPVIVCPNTNVLMLRFMAMVLRAGEGFKKYERTILESHQSTKTSEAGTARSLAKSLGIEINKIESVRDPAIQENTLGIPADHLGRHALHRIQIKDDSVCITLESKVLGTAPYAAGLAEILSVVMARKLEARVYDILEFF